MGVCRQFLFLEVLMEGWLKMGLRGPAPKPDSVKILDGNPGKRPIKNKKCVEMAYSAPPKPPKRLMKYAKDAWKRLAPMLTAWGMLTPMTVDYFAEVCQWYARYQVTSEKVTEEGEEGVYKMQESNTGYKQQHPMITQMNQYYDKWEKGIKEFGMTPMSWARYMSINGDGKTGGEAEDDPLEELLG